MRIKTTGRLFNCCSFFRKLAEFFRTAICAAHIDGDQCLRLFEMGSGELHRHRMSRVATDGPHDREGQTRQVACIQTVITMAWCLRLGVCGTKTWIAACGGPAASVI